MDWVSPAADLVSIVISYAPRQAGESQPAGTAAHVMSCHVMSCPWQQLRPLDAIEQREILRRSVPLAYQRALCKGSETFSRFIWGHKSSKLPTALPDISATGTQLHVNSTLHVSCVKVSGEMA
jgi:hypothetical protein